MKKLLALFVLLTTKLSQLSIWNRHHNSSLASRLLQYTLNTTSKFYSFIVKTINPKEINGEFLGGKVEKNETPLQAVIRETKEETGFDISNQAIETLKTVYIEYNEKKHFVYHAFHTQLQGNPGSVKIN